MSFEHPNRSNASIHEVEREIMRRPPEHNTTNLDLDRMNLMLDVLGHPEESFRVIHVTGTNGKGSTARMAEAICRAYGMRTGLYTSPHLERINERIAIDGQSLSDDDFVDTWDQVKDLVDLVDMKMEQTGKPRMSFFEVLTHRLLGIEMEDLSDLMKKSTNPCVISSMCTIFAESEIISLLSQKVPVEDIAAGTGRSIARRILAMGRSAQISYAEPIVFSGGVANNEAIADIFADLLGKPVTAIKMPQSTAALGAALRARKMWAAEQK